MIVYVVMGNDFPDSVWFTKDAAEEYCALKRADKTTFGQQRIYWRVYEFEVWK